MTTREDVVVAFGEGGMGKVILHHRLVKLSKN